LNVWVRLGIGYCVWRVVYNAIGVGFIHPLSVRSTPIRSLHSCGIISAGLASPRFEQYALQSWVISWYDMHHGNALLRTLNSNPFCSLIYTDVVHLYTNQRLFICTIYAQLCYL
jgi:hypothetical protein